MPCEIVLLNYMKASKCNCIVGWGHFMLNKTNFKCKCNLPRWASKSKYILAIALHKWQNQNMLNGNLFWFIIVKYTTYKPKSNSHTFCTFCKENTHTHTHTHILHSFSHKELKFITKWNSAPSTTIKKIIIC